MNNEVAEFLRRAAQRRAQLEQQARAQAEAAARSRMQPQPAKEEAPILLSAVDEVVEAEVVDLTPTGNRIASSVQRDFSATNRIGKQSERLGQKVDRADDVMEAHLHQTFDHKVGTIASTTASPAPTNVPAVAPSTQIGQSLADGLVQMLRSPSGVRNAILMNEVLRRPTENW